MVVLNDLQPGEKVELEIRVHWITYVILGTYVLVSVVLTALLFFILGGGMFSYMLSIMYWMVLFVFLYIQWLNYELDFFIVTNKRIIGIEQISFLNGKDTQCLLFKVEEVNSISKGILQNILQYGTLSIQTAGSTTTLSIPYVADVRAMVSKINGILATYTNSNIKSKETIEGKN